MRVRRSKGRDLEGEIRDWEEKELWEGQRGGKGLSRRLLRVPLGRITCTKVRDVGVRLDVEIV